MSRDVSPKVNLRKTGAREVLIPERSKIGGPHRVATSTSCLVCSFAS